MKPLSGLSQVQDAETAEMAGDEEGDDNA